MCHCVALCCAGQILSLSLPRALEVALDEVWAYDVDLLHFVSHELIGAVVRLLVSRQGALVGVGWGRHMINITQA